MKLWKWSEWGTGDRLAALVAVGVLLVTGCACSMSLVVGLLGGAVTSSSDSMATTNEVIRPTQSRPSAVSSGPTDKPAPTTTDSLEPEPTTIPLASPEPEEDVRPTNTQGPSCLVGTVAFREILGEGVPENRVNDLGPLFYVATETKTTESDTLQWYVVGGRVGDTGAIQLWLTTIDPGETGGPGIFIYSANASAAQFSIFPYPSVVQQRFGSSHPDIVAVRKCVTSGE